MTITDRIEVNPKVMMGKPVIRGTRIPLELILRKISEGASEADLLEAYPKLTHEDNRDRGRSHDLRPPTPPCVRVRTRRFMQPCLMPVTPALWVRFSSTTPPLDAPLSHPRGLHPQGL